MSRSLRPVVLWWALSSALVVAMPRSAAAVIFHPGDEAGVAIHPDDSLMGRWANSGVTDASAVVISPNHVLTTQHQGNPSDSTRIVIDGVSYRIAEDRKHPDADLRVLRITTEAGDPADLGTYASILSTPVSQPTAMVLGGFGKPRGNNLTTPMGSVYGYRWGTADDQLRWGFNRIDQGLAVSGDGDTPLYVADFDGPSGPDYEAIPADFDSGGGWFVNVGSPGSPDWRLVAMNWGTEHAGSAQAWFATSTDPSAADPDLFYGVKLDPFVPWIQLQIPEPGSLALIGAGTLMMFGPQLRRMAGRRISRR